MTCGWETMYSGLSSNRVLMVVRVAGSLAYLDGDGMLIFEERIGTVGELKCAIEERTKIPVFKQRVFSSEGRICDDDGAAIHTIEENVNSPNGPKMFMIVDEKRERRERREAAAAAAAAARRKKLELEEDAVPPPDPRWKSCALH